MSGTGRDLDVLDLLGDDTEGDLVRAFHQRHGPYQQPYADAADVVFLSTTALDDPSPARCPPHR